MTTRTSRARRSLRAAEAGYFDVFIGGGKAQQADLRP